MMVQVFLLGKYILNSINQTKAKPKYQLEVSLRSTITFHIDEDFYGFSIPYSGQ